MNRHSAHADLPGPGIEPRPFPDGPASGPAGIRESEDSILRVRRSGVLLEVTAPEDLVEEVLGHVPPGAEIVDGGCPVSSYRLQRDGFAFVVSSGGEPLCPPTTLDGALDVIEDGLRFDTACASAEHLFIHAGVVAHAGRAMILPGSSGVGKSHLVAALVAAGALYYSDEFALIDSTGRVHPYPQRLALARRQDGLKVRCRAEDLGGRVGAEPLPIGMVLATRFRPGARFRPTGMSPARIVLELLAHAVRARTAPDRALATLRAVAATTLGVSTPRGEAGDLARDLLGLLEQPPTTTS